MKISPFISYSVPVLLYIVIIKETLENTEGTIKNGLIAVKLAP